MDHADRECERNNDDDQVDRSRCNRNCHDGSRNYSRSSSQNKNNENETNTKKGTNNSIIISKKTKKIKPPKEEEGVSSWSKDQMAESPTLLPTLKFHDLVFGHDLGEGSFGSVRYARLIDRTRTRSHWSEYAVKVISTEKIKEMGYRIPFLYSLRI